MAALPPCSVAMESCSGAHPWAREFAKFGHSCKPIAPKFVTPIRMSGRRSKNDAADCTAICAAALKPEMRFVPVKSSQQQAVTSVHRLREGLKEACVLRQKAVVALANKNARILWAILTRSERFDANHLPDKPEAPRQLTPTPPCPA